LTELPSGAALVGVAFNHLHARERNMKARGNDLRKGRGVALPVIVGAKKRLHTAVGLKTDRDCLEKTDAGTKGSRETRRSYARGFHVAGETKTAQLTASWLLFIK
jgi:hypothetical protein